MVVWVKEGIFADTENRGEVICIKPSGVIVQSLGRPEMVKIVCKTDIVAVEITDIADETFTARIKHG